MDRHIKDVLENYLKEGRIATGFTNQKIQKFWNKEMGSAITDQTKKIVLVKGELRIKVDSSVLKYELFQNANRIKEMFNNEFGENVVRSVRLL